jgi:hypothetical protein
LQTLHAREHRQTRLLWTRSHTLIFFRNHRQLARTVPGRRAIRVANVWLPILRRELRETRAQLHPQPSASVDACLSELISRESGWNVRAQNPVSGAYGLPQALPASKMASAGVDWATNPATQIRWMLGYVRHYGGSCGALAFQKRNGWY